MIRIPIKHDISVLVEHEKLLINMANEARRQYKLSKPYDFKRRGYWFGRFEAYYEQLQVLYGKRLR